MIVLYCTLSLLINILVRDLVKSEKREKAREKDHVSVCVRVGEVEYDETLVVLLSYFI